jgi:hypothetical protein
MTRQRLVGLLWVAMLVFSPVYLFSSGLPQPADMIAAVVVGLILLMPIALTVHEKFMAAAAVGFVWYTAVVNLAWAVILSDVTLIRSPLFYFFNSLLLIAALALYGQLGDRFLLITLHAAVGSVVLLLLSVPFTVDLTTTRQALLFNNPNQLGYHAVLSGSIVAVAARRYPLPMWYVVTAMLAVMATAALSLSKAALLSVGAMLVVIFGLRPKVGLAVGGVALAAGALFANSFPLIGYVLARLGDIGGAADDNLAGRGYDRIWNHAHYLFFGAGEGAYQRFNTMLDGELHSSWGTLLFAYGLVGCGFAALMLYAIVKRAGVGQLKYLLPVFLYGLTHQGLRATGLWILLAYVLLASYGHGNPSQISTAAVRMPRPRNQTP